jgi:hypothetical protein
VEGEQADGVLRVIAVPDAPPSDVTFMIRPLDTVLTRVKAMGWVLADRVEVG